MSIDERLRDILIGVEEAGESAGSADIDKAISEIKKVIAEEYEPKMKAYHELDEEYEPEIPPNC